MMPYPTPGEKTGISFAISIFFLSLFPACIQMGNGRTSRDTSLHLGRWLSGRPMITIVDHETDRSAISLSSAVLSSTGAPKDADRVEHGDKKHPIDVVSYLRRE